MHGQSNPTLSSLAETIHQPIKFNLQINPSSIYFVSVTSKTEAPFSKFRFTLAQRLF
jgi:hypothetical protein